MIRFGPAGLGSFKEAKVNLESFAKNGISACELSFTYSVYLGEKEALEIGNIANKLNIRLSIHAPYWINLNSSEKYKIEQSKKRILDCCKIGDKFNVMGGCYIVFHAGFYGKQEKERTFQKIKEEILDLKREINKNKWNVILAPETMGKINVFGSDEEIIRLSKETECGLCLDFAHLYARSGGRINYNEIYSNFKEIKNLHCHFSGIEFGEKGERNHKITEEKEIRKLLKILPKDAEITIINESPEPFNDSKKMINIFNSFS